MKKSLKIKLIELLNEYENSITDNDKHEVVDELTTKLINIIFKEIITK